MDLDSTSNPAPARHVALNTGAFSVAPGQTLLNAALAAGVSVPYSCQRGACGSCRVQVVSGTHERLRPATPDGFRVAENELLMCQCRPTSDMRLHVPDWTPKAVPAIDLRAADAAAWEQVGEGFEMSGVLEARRLSIEAVERIGRLMRPGMTTQQGLDAADRCLREMGAIRTWHPTYIRFGADAQFPWNRPLDRARVLRERDVIVVDIGPVWGEYEGDYGDTFVTGDDPDHLACAQAAREIHAEVRAQWALGLTGVALYDFASACATRRGYELVPEVAGHRIADFPHALYGKQNLAKARFAPAQGLWVLEIQIRQPEQEIGAFYEDVLLP
ncbi:metallopeptidase family m24 domain-containing protein [Ditylenchus destructor]|nr:metallopeptidase family m24 domain-containing protein [Ditylenchus destructor]